MCRRLRSRFGPALADLSVVKPSGSAPVPLQRSVQSKVITPNMSITEMVTATMENVCFDQLALLQQSLGRS